jgi:hypothetical protein
MLRRPRRELTRAPSTHGASELCREPNVRQNCLAPLPHFLRARISSSSASTSLRSTEKRRFIARFRPRADAERWADVERSRTDPEKPGRSQANQQNASEHNEKNGAASRDGPRFDKTTLSTCRRQIDHRSGHTPRQAPDQNALRGGLAASLTRPLRSNRPIVIWYGGELTASC